MSVKQFETPEEIQAYIMGLQKGMDYAVRMFMGDKPTNEQEELLKKALEYAVKELKEK